jgi:hypothetical protein
MYIITNYCFFSHRRSGDIHGTTDDLKRAYDRLDEANAPDVNKQLLKRF